MIIVRVSFIPNLQKVQFLRPCLAQCKDAMANIIRVKKLGGEKPKGIFAYRDHFFNKGLNLTAMS